MLVVIGLIIGGVLIGQDLINAAATRAQISQIEKYNSAVNTFRNKYGGIPGDLPLSQATQFGFFTDSSCNGGRGERDGNGLIDGWYNSPNSHQESYETGMFWVDLSTSSLIDGKFPGNGAASVTCYDVIPALNLTYGSTYVGNYLPVPKIGGSNFLYVYEMNAVNWYGLSAVTGVAANGVLSSNALIPVTYAYNIDKKVDDGLPTAGTVVAAYMNSSTTSAQLANPQATDTATSCYNTTTNTYSTNVTNGSGPNCALSFKMQGAAR